MDKNEHKKVKRKKFKEGIFSSQTFSEFNQKCFFKIHKFGIPRKNVKIFWENSLFGKTEKKLSCFTLYRKITLIKQKKKNKKYRIDFLHLR